ncbi:MAG: hypothetical protein HKO90_08890 [Flavobacteriaceae bacterium]|nr:hypothetical protein [Flavobacteriaceae bacterium]
MKPSFPNLFIPGAGKSGTSALHECLDQHPAISMSSKKEPHYWTRPDFDEYTDFHRTKYMEYFNWEEHIKYQGESSTGYMQFPKFIGRIKSHYEEFPRFIFILRNPVDRCYSHYWWLKGMGSESLSFKEAVLSDLDIEPHPGLKLPEGNYKCYFQYGLYGKWLERFYRAFNSMNIHIVCSEDLKDDPLGTVNGCFEFLGLEPLESIIPSEANKSIILKKPGLYKLAKQLSFNQLNVPQLVKDMTPEFVKKLIRKHLITIVLKYTRTKKTYPIISDTDRLWLKGLYQEDVRHLKELTGMSFEKWTDFIDA